MPIYEYECSQCHHAFELVQKISAPVATHCDECGQETAKRLISAAGFQLKGTGWYATDFKDKPKTMPTAQSADATATSTSSDKGSAT